MYSKPVILAVIGNFKYIIMETDPKSKGEATIRSVDIIRDFTVFNIFNYNYKHLIMKT